MKQDIYKICSIVIFVVVFASLCYACKDTLENSNERRQAREEARLESLYKEIQGISEQVSCQNSSEWKFVAIGSKACGGPTGYISYSIHNDTTAFLEKVRSYTLQQKDFNKKWSINSICSLIQVPKQVKCENGKPTFVY